ncbi:MAG: aldo/keto reductase [Polyangiaceae bacterium]|nr:aldo/keto reductase [Polyangiaceae bacterium]
MIPETSLGRCGLPASSLGLGGGPLGDAALSDVAAERLVHAALERGVRLVDTARSYGESERRIGKALRGRSEHVTVVAKGGYGVEGFVDWTPEAVTAGIERARATLQRDVLDVLLLHGCGIEKLVSGELVEPLVQARDAGRVRAIGYAGEGGALLWAADCEALDVIECSISILDQEALRGAVRIGMDRGKGIIANRALGTAPWRQRTRPNRSDLANYWDRLQALVRETGALENEWAPWADTAIRFAAYTGGVSSALVATARIEHFLDAIESVGRGPLREAQAHRLRGAYERCGAQWAAVL